MSLVQFPQIGQGVPLKDLAGYSTVLVQSTALSVAFPKDIEQGSEGVELKVVKTLGINVIAHFKELPEFLKVEEEEKEEGEDGEEEASNSLIVGTFDLGRNEVSSKKLLTSAFYTGLKEKHQGVMRIQLKKVLNYFKNAKAAGIIPGAAAPADDAEDFDETEVQAAAKKVGNRLMNVLQRFSQNSRQIAT
jgi:hypothetical protein